MSTNAFSRRNWLKQMAAGAATLGMGVPISLVTFGAEEAAFAAEPGHPWYEHGLIGDSLMDERLLFYLGHSWYRMSEISECLDTASRIEPGDSAGWRREWYATADRLRRTAETSLAGGHELSAGESLLRATSYYLAGLMYTEGPDDPDMPRAARASAECFEQALPLLGIPGVPVEIPYEDSALPGYFFRSPLATGPAPVLIAHQGMDASIEESLFLATESLKRGYHALLFHHPGQGLALREKGLTFRPDWENVITPVVDFALAQPGVDPDRIALTGLSFGGALITRALAFEKRVKIGIPNPAVYSWWDFLSQFLFGSYPQLGKLLEQDPEAFNTAFSGFLDQAPSMFGWWVSSAMWKFGAASPADLMTRLKAYSNADIVDQVTCTMLVMDGAGETWAAGQAQKLYEALTCPKDYLLFTAEDTGLLHNQTGAIAVSVQRMFDWLDAHI